MTATASALGDETQQARPLSRGARVGAWAAVLVGVIALQLLRQSGTPSWRTVYAEDGVQFFAGTEHIGDLLEPYAGYWTLVPRLLGLGSNLVRIDDVARFFAVGGAAVTTLCALAVWSFSRRLVPSAALRAVLALSIPLLPAAGFENLANGVNTIWPLLFATWWALLFHPRDSKEAVPAAAVAFLGAASNGLALAYVPVAGLLAWKRRDQPGRISLAAFGAGALAQVVFVIASRVDPSTAASHLGDVAPVYGVRVLGSALFGEQWVGDAWDALGDALPALAIAAAVVLLAVLVVRSRGVRRCLGALTLAYSIAMFVGPVWIRGTEPLRLIPDAYSSTGTRYSGLSIWLLLSAVVILLSGCRLSARVRTLAVGAIVLQFVVVAAAGFRVHTPRSDGPTWEPSVTAAERTCRRRPSQVVTLTLTPPPMLVAVTCDRVL